MDVYIIHIREEYKENSINDEYCARCTERQALQYVCKYITEGLLESALYMQYSVLEAANALAQVDKVKEAIGIINDFSKSVRQGEALGAKVTIKITKSQFLGSPFE